MNGDQVGQADTSAKPIVVVKADSGTDQSMLEILNKKGVLIKPSVRFWRAKTKLTAGDLGLSADQIPDELIKLGNKRMFPEEVMSGFVHLEAQINHFVEDMSKPFLNGVARFVPNDLIQTVVQKLEEFRVLFDALTANFFDKYDENREKAKIMWQEAAAKMKVPPEFLIERIDSDFPPAHRLKRKFGFDWSLFQIAVPKEIEIQVAEAGEQIEIAKIRKEANKKASENIRASVEKFISETVSGFRAEFSALCKQVLETMLSGKSGVHQKTLNRLNKFIGDFKALNFAGDIEMENELEKFRQEFLTTSAEEYRNDEFAQVALRNTVRDMTTKFLDMAEADKSEVINRFGRMGVRKINTGKEEVHEQSSEEGYST